MQKIVKKSFHLFSMITLMTFVFFGGIFAKAPHENNGTVPGDKDKNSDGNRLYSFLPLNAAIADAPTDGGSPAPPSDGTLPSDCDGGDGGGC